MPYVPAETAWRAVRGARQLREAIDDEDSSASAAVRAALKDDDLRLWIESWVMPGLDALVAALDPCGKVAD